MAIGFAGVTRLHFRLRLEVRNRQSLVCGGKPPNRPFYGTYVMSASEDVLDGLCESTAELIDAMTTCWAARQANPQMIVQHGRQ